MTLTLSLFFLQIGNLRVKLNSRVLLPLKLSSFQPFPANHLALRLSECCANAQTIRALGWFFRGKWGSGTGAV